ncbi:hypothetical protein D915_001939 [Fasciola hepatica]|uniref:Uncharacterized protein n=1 Tax=Fasciola hepatica TaxID=6192 RepID=A0A4E0S3E1_FASHE|nr:hypothetical protein D915_001939 [Fasciola hepatica]
MTLSLWYSLCLICGLSLTNSNVIETLPKGLGERVPPCYECMLYGAHDTVTSLSSRPPNCPTKCVCPLGRATDQKPQCPQGVPVVRDGCDCCWICARQSGESCSARYICDPTDGLECMYPGEGNETVRQMVPNGGSNGVARSRAQLTAVHSSLKGHGICWKRQGRPCRVNGTWLSHGDVQTNQCRHQCSCMDGILFCTDLCVTQEQQRPPDAFCDPLDGDGPQMQLRLMPPAPGDCCRRWMCVVVADIQDRESRLWTDSDEAEVEPVRAVYRPKGLESVLEETSPSSMKVVQDLCISNSRQSSPWTSCSQSCGLGLSTRWTTETVDCHNVTQTRLCFWRPCRRFFTSKNNTFTPTLKFARPGYLKFTTLPTDPANSSNFIWSNPKSTMDPGVGGQSGNANSKTSGSTSGSIVCQMERAFQSRFCNLPPPDSCCWPSRSTTRRLRFRCTGGRIVYHFFEWINTCQCSPVPCEKVLVDRTSEYKIT